MGARDGGRMAGGTNNTAELEAGIMAMNWLLMNEASSRPVRQSYLLTAVRFDRDGDDDGEGEKSPRKKELASTPPTASAQVCQAGSIEGRGVATARRRRAVRSSHIGLRGARARQRRARAR